ncbi:hypothetical protein [Sphingomonas abietis]|uniref:Uncharacterized protein n=1 Tax=Sphingomonas abietis TaxID=3012344 RepID=A0ABY7NNK1_9SPHN|nr:hypothetical protein [Sphingomonas abietis]WBO23111.1 hypothetical protein PBT88_02930 [Sphingomonas abietis]
MGVQSSEGMMLVRADLCGRLDALEQSLARRGSIGASGQAAAMAGLAADFGLAPVQRLAEGLAVALDSGGRGAAIGPWIERLRDAIGCESVDDVAGTSWLASVWVRLAG